MLKKLCHQSGARLIEDKWPAMPLSAAADAQDGGGNGAASRGGVRSAVTHVVCRTEHGRLAKRTIKYLMGIANVRGFPCRGCLPSQSARLELASP